MRKLIILLFVACITFSCDQPDRPVLPALIPIPNILEETPVAFEITPDTRIVVDMDNEEQLKIANYLADRINDVAGHQLLITGKASKNYISLEAPTKAGLAHLVTPAPEPGHVTPGEDPGLAGNSATEVYQLDVERSKIRLAAASNAGLFHGIQTLMQLIPLRDTCHPDAPVVLPGVHIEDQPRFAWRGLMLDVSRHFFTVEEVKAYIDQMAEYKFNIFHWHLTDDQGWRIEIKSLPRLTEVGAWRVPRTGPWWTYEPPREGEEATYGGFYTHDQIREVVQYAKERYIDIVPEIDVPGHSLAMIAAYPHLSSTELPYQVNPGSKFYTIEDNALDPSKEEVYEVMDRVFTEVAELFPFEYIHVGGDECYKGFWAKDAGCQALMKREGMTHVDELQSYFIRRMEKILQSKGKKLIGWDEILEGGLAPEATVMSWRGMSGGIKAAEMGHQVVMTPTQHCYLDLYQGDPLVEPMTYSMLKLRDVYRFEPVPEGIQEELILGGQGNLWTESVYTLSHAQYMTWPRSFALAEVLWSEKGNQEWSDFVNRTLEHFQRLEGEGVNYAVSAFECQVKITAENLKLKDKGKENGKAKFYVELVSEVDGLNFYYTFDDSFPDPDYPKYDGPIAVPEGATTFRVVSYLHGKQIGRQLKFELKDLQNR